MNKGFPCNGWNNVWWTTTYRGWTYIPGIFDAPWAHTLKDRISIFKGTAQPNCQPLQCNPVTITINEADNLVNITFGLGIDIRGKDPTARFRIAVWDILPDDTLSVQNEEKLNEGVKNIPKNPTIVTVKEIKDLRQTFEIETGYGDANAWVEWIKYTVQSLNHSNCYACASGWPIAQVVPFSLGWTKDPQGMQCIIALYQEKTAWGNEACKSLSLLFPPMSETDVQIPPTFSTAIGNHTACLSRQGVKATRLIGNFSLCSEVLNVTKDLAGNYSRLGIPRADLWWYCGGKVLRSTLPSNWGGTCALVQLVIPFTLAFEKGVSQNPGRNKRSLGVSFDDSIYIDPIGVPRGVPDEFKARNQIVAGFESLFWWVTINKNVDWINYIYYNQQRFINYTKSAIKGIAEQLDATSKMAWENRIALDMMLAEKGGVCVMLGTRCCTFIPNNTAPDGTITKALQGLTTLADELAENSGIDTSISGWVDSWFGKWKGAIISIFTSLITVAGALVTIGCCVIPCVRGLVQRLIETALLKQTLMEPPLYSNKMMVLEEMGNEESEEEEEMYTIMP
ncbi:endogenous retrovirus group FC1 Env polyprotein-like [Lagopus leucura]|uniref:endogenous retrovirus group FC1 Env polyprotein-like n=1 Tax=Lagopus leucura TaxID=30410 RepID=UPI001C666A53|nr:endogenous retrovirus group FC1 Env polyprotein-like [Lagopus leucura]